jgi:hypothetical protein
MDSISRIIEQVSGEASSALESVTRLVPGGWGSAIALLFLLPVFGIFLRPLLRLGGAATNSIAAIGSAAMVCVSSLIVMLIQYVTVCVQALRPSTALLPIVRLLIVAALIVTAIKLWAIPLGVVAGVVGFGLAVCILAYSRFWMREFPGRRVLKRKGARLALCGGALLCAVWAVLYFLNRPQGDLNQCLQNGQIQQACVGRLHAARF